MVLVTFVANKHTKFLGYKASKEPSRQRQVYNQKGDKQEQER